MTLNELPIGAIITDKKTKFNGKPIEWLVADHEKYPGTVLLSKNVLCCRPFDEPKEYYEDEYRKKYGSNRWRDSDIREWLDNEILGKSFSSRLADRVISVLNVTVLSPCDRELYKNECAVDRTKDTVFLLSDSEAGYNGDSEAFELFRRSDGEKYLKAEVCPGLAWYWWLRSPYAGCSCFAHGVNADGSLHYDDAYGDGDGVRPACVISNYAPVKKRKNGGYKFDWKV